MEGEKEVMSLGFWLTSYKSQAKECRKLEKYLIHQQQFSNNNPSWNILSPPTWEERKGHSPPANRGKRMYNTCSGWGTTRKLMNWNGTQSFAICNNCWFPILCPIIITQISMPPCYNASSTTHILLVACILPEVLTCNTFWKIWDGGKLRKTTCWSLGMMSNVRFSNEKKTAINAGKNTSCKQQNCQYQGRPDYKITQWFDFFLLPIT